MPTLIATPSTITLLAIQNQLAALAPFTNYNNGQANLNLATTINVKRGIFATVYPGTNTPRHFAFGIGINGADSSGQETVPYRPRITNGDLYRPIPMCMHTLAYDLEDFTGRANYRLRQTITVGGTQYVIYWLKILDFASTNSNKVQFARVQIGSPPVVVSDPYAAIVMSPTPSTDTVAESQVIAHLTCRCEMTFAELETVFAVYVPSVLGIQNSVRVSEIGIYSGVDVAGEKFDENDTLYNELAYTQLAFHRCTTGQDMNQPGARYTETITLENGNLGLLN